MQGAKKKRKGAFLDSLSSLVRFFLPQQRLLNQGYLFYLFIAQQKKKKKA